MKQVLFYYSLTGNCKEIANHLQNESIDIREIKVKRKLPKRFFFRVLTGGFLAGLGVKDRIIDTNLDISNIDCVLIASPIWNGRFSPALNGLLKQVDLSGKEVIFIFSSGSGEGTKALKMINKNYPQAKYVFLKEPLKYPDELNKLTF